MRIKKINKTEERIIISITTLRATMKKYNKLQKKKIINYIKKNNIKLSQNWEKNPFSLPLENSDIIILKKLLAQFEESLLMLLNIISASLDNKKWKKIPKFNLALSKNFEMKEKRLKLHPYAANIFKYIQAERLNQPDRMQNFDINKIFASTKIMILNQDFVDDLVIEINTSLKDIKD